LDALEGSEIQEVTISADDDIGTARDGTLKDAVVAGIVLDDGEEGGGADHVAECLRLTAGLGGFGRRPFNFQAQLFVEFVEEGPGM
jgi:hypothetical protein